MRRAPLTIALTAALTAACGVVQPGPDTASPTPAATGGARQSLAKDRVKAPAKATPEPSASPARPPRVPRGTEAGFMVFDRATGRATVGYEVHTRFRSASVVKILIAVDYLESREPGTAVPARDRDLLRRMLRSSDDDAATALWKRGGQGAIVDRMVRRAGLTETERPPASKPGFWGYTALSAADVVRTYRYLLDRADPKVRDLVLGHLRDATRCAADDFDQYFGIPSALPRPWAVKQGWSGYGSTPAVRCAGTRASSVSETVAGPMEAPAVATAAGPPVNLSRPVLHTTGLVGKGDRLIVAVLTLQPAGASFTDSATRLTALTRAVYRSGRPR
ncbi:hypothetical protein ACGFIV_14555 [Sphaerisporangium sp. NPDC049003]|uniref:hypothetical protein n=1 Tax=Sphaerisporangium sp. NPDC049003 TaxID=3364517 RepID=UPI0037202898